MVTIKPANDKGYFWQWDTGQYLRVDGAPEVHFGRPGEESTIDVAVVDGLARVPDACLEKDGALSVYAYDSNHTLCRAVIEVLRRQKPAGYIFTPAETKTWSELDKRIEALEAGGGVAGVASVNGDTGHIVITAETLGALTPDDLQDAADAALAQAKESGAFDGAPGPQGPQGAPGKDGKNAVEDISLGLTSATVGQIAKITAVDADGKPTAWEPVDMASGGELRWQKINSLTLSEQTNDIIIDKDANGVAVANYNAVAMKVEFYVPADSTQTDNNGMPWVYPSTVMNNGIRAIGNLSGWKTINRRNVLIFIGDINGIVSVGNVTAQLVPDLKDIQSLAVMNGVRLFISNTSNHWPVGTIVSLEVLSERD